MSNILNPNPALQEAGKVLSKLNASDLVNAFKAVKNLLTRAGIDPDTDEEEVEAKESLSANNVAERIARALKLAQPMASYLYVRDVYPTYAVYSPGYSEGKLYAVNYTVDPKDNVSIGSQQEVLAKTTYTTLTGDPLDPPSDDTDASESLIEILGDLIPLTEAASASTGEIPVKLIAPGKGSSGYYPKAILERDGPRVFTRGLQMFWDHPTPEEAKSRPEGSMNKLAGVLTEGAIWQEDGKEGPGLYAKAKIFSDYAAVLKEKGPHTGLSIRASGKAKIGEVEGSKMPIVEAIVSASSVDFVTRPGAGGKVVSLTESATSSTGDLTMGDTTKLEERLKAQEDQIARLQEAQAMGRAEGLIEGWLKGSSLPQATKNRIAPQLARQFELTEAGVIDEAKLKSLVEAAVTEEAKYLSSLGYGKVTGMGGSGSSAGSEDDPAKLEESLNTLIKGLNTIA